MRKMINYIWYGDDDFAGIQYIWIAIEIGFSRVQQFFGYDKCKREIPKGVYCYVWDEERTKMEGPPEHGGYWTSTCKYYRSTQRTKGLACTYVGFMGFDFGLYDQCKICGVNDEH